ncbi:MAG: HEPN domain-containing protein [Chloroflexota bacterium]|nr:HEPN domain-containing protein [Chloroflexota bacterium]
MNELRRKDAQGWWALAVEYLRQARRAGQNGSFRLTVDGAYNAAELAVKGLLILRLERLPTSHDGLIRVFSREYVVTGEVNRMIGHRLSISLDLQNKARYKWNTEITAEHVTQVAALAQELIALLEKTLSLLEQQLEING